MPAFGDKVLLSVVVEKKIYTSGNEDVAVLKDISFTASARELVVITGPSGCGKTTLLNLIAGLDTDYQGQIDLPEHVDGPADDTLPLSFVFQEPRLLPWRTVRQNINLVRTDGVCSGAGSATELLRQMGIEDALDRYPSQISLGMSRRVALARAFSVSAPLLIMDEPFSSIDELTAASLRSLLLSQLEVASRTVLFVTHSIREALFLGSRLLVLSSRPARLLEDIKLPGKPGRSADEIEALRTDILQRFPRVLR